MSSYPKHFYKRFRIRLRKWNHEQLDKFREIIEARIDASSSMETAKEDLHKEADRYVEMVHGEDYAKFQELCVKDYIDEQLDLYNDKQITKEILVERISWTSGD